MKTALTQNPVPTGRIFFILLLMTIILGAGNARAQGMIDVTSASQQTVRSKPGQIIAFGIKVTNRSTETSTFKSLITLPPGWRIVTRDFPFDLPARGSDVRLISFSVPPDAPAKGYDVRYTIRDSAGHEGSTTVGVLVLPVIQLELQVLDVPRFAVAGSTFTTTFLLSNNGNASTPVRLNYRSSHSFHIAIDSVVTQLGPREVRQLKVSVATAGRSAKISHTLELEVVPIPDSTFRVRTSSVVEVVSRAAKGEEEYFEFPVTARVREVGQDGLFATQAELYGYGSLNEQHTDRLEFLFRGPETQTKSVLGQRDEYRVSYRAKNFELYGGDLNYSLSTLTEYGRYATGAGGKASIGNVTAGGFYNATRWSVPSQKEAAGFLSYDVAKGATIGVNYLDKREQFNSQIATVRGLFAPLTASNLDLEYGTGTKDGKRDDAYSVRFDGNRQWIAYDLRYVNAGPNFGGYYRDINFLSANVNIEALKNLRIESYVRQEDRNLARDTNQVYAPQDKYYQVGASYSDYVALYFRRNIQQDQLENPKYRRQEDALQGRLGYNFRIASVSLNADYGSTRDELLNEDSPYKRLALFASFQPIVTQNYSTSLEYSKERNLYTSQDQERLSASLNAWILFGQATQFQMNVYTSRVNAAPVQTYSLIEGSIEHTFPFNHKITLRARENIISSASTIRSMAYLLEYSVPLGIPIKRITAVGQLRGTIKDEQGIGIANVLINVGENAALTNNKGEYFFASLKPGSAFLTVDKASIGLDRITTQSMPIELTIRGGEESQLDIGVTRSVFVSGTVERFGTKEQSFGDTTTTYVDLGGKSGVFLELTNGTEINRRVTDNRGRFSFTDLRPGTWTLKVIGGDIPEYHIIVPQTVELILKSGEKNDVMLQLRPRKRTIKILQEGTIIPQAPAKVEKKLELQPAPKKTQLPCIVYFDARKRGFILQISSWVTKRKAIRVARQAEGFSGKKSFTVTARIPSLGTRYRVFLSLFKTAKEAEAMCTKLNALE